MTKSRISKAPRATPKRRSGLRVGPKPVPVEKPRRRYVDLMKFLSTTVVGRLSASELADLGERLEAYGAEQFSAGYYLGSKEI